MIERGDFMNTIASAITRSIREKKWLQIEYHNVNEEKNTYFWICILDIIPETKKLKVHLFNQEYSYDIKHGWIYFSQIKHADVLEGTSYQVPEDLLTKLQQHHKEFDFLEYTGVNERILQYYLKCYQQDRDATVTNYNMVTGLDTDILHGLPYELKQQQFQDFVLNLRLYQKQKKQKFQQKLIKLAINVLSIKNERGISPIVYRDIFLDIEQRILLTSTSNIYNIKLDKDEQGKGAFLLSHYFDGDLHDFITAFEQDRKACLQHINENLRKHEFLDEHPYIFKLEQYIPVNIEYEYQEINEQYHEQTLSAPLKCFFGLNEKERKHKSRSILTVENETNMDQLRSEFNAMIRNVVYVQGPPGTGKTRTIINIILSSLLNDSTALIVSNNNEAINNIQRKITSYSYKHTVFALPMLRLGSNECIKSSLHELHEHLSDYITLDNITSIRSRIKELKKYLLQNTSDVKEMLDTYESRAEIFEQLDSLRQVIVDIQKETDVDEISKSMTINGIRAQIQNLSNGILNPIEEAQLTTRSIDMNQLMEYLFLSSCEHRYRLGMPKHQDLYEILSMEDETERFQQFRTHIEDDVHLRNLLDVFPFIISTNISVTKLGSPNPNFDLMIMDEASQCNNAQALLPMARCRRALFVGDQNQLQPVILLNSAKNAMLMQSYDIPSAYNYKDNSILSTLLKVDTLSKFILLREHYRCHDKIISFANKKYYDNELTLCSKLQNVDALKLIDVKSRPASQKNTSEAEVKALLVELQKNTYQDIAIITPFRKQAEYIERTLAQRGLQHVKVGTIHTFQGDEKDRIILCSGIASNAQPGSFHWMKNNQQLLNVATTRAKENLTLLCDVHKIIELSNNEQNDFLELVNYIKTDGNYEVAYRENEVFTNKVKNFKYYNMEAEEQLLKTLLHIKSVYGQITIKSKVSVRSVLSLSDEDCTMFFNGKKSVFDFVVYDLTKRALLAIEVIGSDHYNQKKMQEHNRRKHELCSRSNVVLISIGNDYVRRYSFIKQAIMDAIAF